MLPPRRVELSGDNVGLAISAQDKMSQASSGYLTNSAAENLSVVKTDDLPDHAVLAQQQNDRVA